jgi:hypothetical protein
MLFLLAQKSNTNFCCNIARGENLSPVVRVQREKSVKTTTTTTTTTNNCGFVCGGKQPKKK